MDRAAPRYTGLHFRSVTFFNDTKQLFYMQTNHFVRRTELIKYFQHQIGGECLCPRKMQQVTFFGDTKEGMKMCIHIYIMYTSIYVYIFRNIWMRIVAGFNFS